MSLNYDTDEGAIPLLRDDKNRTKLIRQKKPRHSFYMNWMYVKVIEDCELLTLAFGVHIHSFVYMQMLQKYITSDKLIVVFYLSGLRLHFFLAFYNTEVFPSTGNIQVSLSKCLNLNKRKCIVTDLLKALLCNRPENTYHSNECTTIGRPLLGNIWMDTPDKNTW
jgi:hypothetical protein